MKHKNSTGQAGPASRAEMEGGREMIIKGKQRVEVEITREDLASALYQFIEENFTGRIDEAGCDLTTTKDGKVCVGYNPDWIISEDERVATLVDTINILLYGEELTVE